MHDTNVDAQRAGSTAEANANNVVPFTGPTTNGHNESGDQDSVSPTALSGSHLADLTGIDPATPVGDALDGAALSGFNLYTAGLRRIGMPAYDLDTPLGEVWCIPIVIADLTGQEPTAKEVAAWSAETMEDDPQELMAQYVSARTDYATKRATQRNAQKAVERQLQNAGVAPAGRFTLETIEAIDGVGPEVARKARAMVLKENRRAWNAVKPAFHPERLDLISAAELVRFGVEPSVITNLPRATDDDEIDAAERLTRVRAHYVKFRTVDVVDFAGGMVSVTQMRQKEPPRRLLGHWLYRGQLSELIAKPGGGKTFVALGWGLALASGATQRTLGVPGKGFRAKVVYVAAEAPESVYLRVLGWCVHHRVDPSELDHWFAVYPEPVQLTDPEHMRQVRTYIKDNGTELAVFDTRAMVTMGTDENSSGDQGVAIEALKALNRVGCATLVAHHTTKDGSVGDGGRGSGAWFGAAYTSMFLKHDDKLGPVLVCDKNKDGKSKCRHPLTYTKVSVPAFVMPNAAAEERATLALTHIDPFTDNGGKTGELSTKELNTLLVLALKAPHKGMTAPEFMPYASTPDDPDVGYDIGARTKVYAALATLTGEGVTSHKYARVVSEKPKRYRATDEGWNLLVQRELVNQAYADEHRRSAEDVDTPRYVAAGQNIAAALETLINSGEVIPGTSQTMTQRRKLVESHLQVNEQEFSEAAWGAVYARWKDDGWPSTVTTAARAKASSTD